MKITSIVIGTLAAIAHSHSDVNEGTPTIVGARKFLSLTRALKLAPVSKVPNQSNQNSSIEAAPTSDGRCGPGLGSCTNCCSFEGYCGSGPEYCISPDCQYQYGPQCDANVKPSGPSTANIARPLVGDVPYGGVGIYDCVVPGTVAFTYDDGPYSYTADILDKFRRYNAKATFFITGNNFGKGPIDQTPQWTNVIRRMYSEGHQVASHTWTHQSLDEVTSEMFQNQIIYNEMAFRNILGVIPTYLRPPYSQCNENSCGAKLKKLGYHVVYFDVDTAGYLNDDAQKIQNSKDIWDKTIKGTSASTSSFLEIEHDIHYQSAYNLTDYILDSIYANGYKSVTVGECLGDPQQNWYRPAR
ncbi:hypothetical protein K3495_g11291 [Podosphaera aphanis]|nr:hypothetical protein K3495_g11291 [Podosphaera aphanis]